MAAKLITLKVICIHPPSTSSTMMFGLQDKEGNIYDGQSMDNNRLQFSCEVSVQQMESGQPNFTGIFTHGTVQERFLYLTQKALHESDWQIQRRIKIHLRSITWEQIEAVFATDGSYLIASVDGRGTASVPLLGDGWKVEQP